MPVYEYVCGGCDHNFETIQSMKDDALVKCPSCSNDTLRRVLFPVAICSKGEPVTVGQLADRNTQKMGTYELQEKRHTHEEKANEGRKQLPKAERPFWRKTDKVDTQLAKLAPNVVTEKGKVVKSEPLSQKAIDYIVTGKK